MEQNHIGTSDKSDKVAGTQMSKSYNMATEKRSPVWAIGRLGRNLARRS